MSNEINTFQLHKIKFENIEEIENRHKGVERISNVQTSQGYFPELNIYKFAQPIFYNRKKDSLLTEISYYYTEKDSVVRVISYEWDHVKNNDSLYAIFDKNKELFSKFFGNYGSATRRDEPTYWQNELRWENEKLCVFQFILGDKKGAYRTRTILKWK